MKRMTDDGFTCVIGRFFVHNMYVHVKYLFSTENEDDFFPFFFLVSQHEVNDKFCHFCGRRLR